MSAQTIQSLALPLAAVKVLGISWKENTAHTQKPHTFPSPET